ncbi:hypothetical protein H8N00_26435 [Streptomyces sp. AC563]|nr:hypothetical protein [Streptomyces buecherae]
MPARAVGGAALRVAVGERVGQELSGPRMSGLGQEAVGGALFDDLAGAQHQDVVGQFAHHLQVVAEQDERDAAPGHGREFGHHPALGQRVLSRGGLVGDDDARAEKERLGQYDALLLPARELVRVAPDGLRAVGDVGRGQRAEHPLAGGGPPLPARQVAHLTAGDVGEQRAHASGRVEHGRRVLGHVAGEPVGDPDLAADDGARRIAAEQGQAGGGLAAAGGADQRGHPAGPGAQAHAVHQGPARHLDPQVPHFGNGRHVGVHRRFSSPSAGRVER